MPNYWRDPASGIGYQVQVEVPRADEVDQGPGTRPGHAQDGKPLLLRDVADVSEGTMPGEIDRYNMRRVVSMTANIAGRATWATWPGRSSRRSRPPASQPARA